MNSTNHPYEMARRDWLKTATLAGSASFFAASQVLSEATNSPAGHAKKVKGVVFMVSDGMSPGVLTLAEAYSKLKRGHGTRWWKLLTEKSTAQGLMDTGSANSMVTDSAAAASSWGSGRRVNNGAINFDPSGKELEPIAALLKKSTKTRIGLVTTSTVTHATPAGFASAVKARNDEQSIAPQYLDRVDVVLGGGSAFFESSQRADKRDLAGDFAKAGYEVVKDRAQLAASRGDKLLGTFTRGHLPYSIDRDHNEETAARIPSLAEMSKAALERFLSADAPFLLQVEGARIDHAAHLNDIAGLLADQLAFDDAVEAVLTMTAGREDILVVVTSDHGNANPGLNGMGGSYARSTQSFEKILGHTASYERIFAEWGAIKEANPERLGSLIESHLKFKPAKAEAEAMFEMLQKREVIEWSHQLSNPEGLLGQFAGNHTGIGWTGTTHTSDPTLVAATGPQSQRFAGMLTNTDVFAHLMEILG